MTSPSGTNKHLWILKGMDASLEQKIREAVRETILFPYIKLILKKENEHHSLSSIVR